MTTKHNPPLDALRRAVARGKPIDWNVIAPPKPRGKLRHQRRR